MDTADHTSGKARGCVGGMEEDDVSFLEAHQIVWHLPLLHPLLQPSFAWISKAAIAMTSSVYFMVPSLFSWEPLASPFVLDLLSCSPEWVMASNGSSAGAVAWLSTKGLPSGVTISQLCWKGTLETASQHCAPLPCQSISKCRKDSHFPDRQLWLWAAARPSQKRNKWGSYLSSVRKYQHYSGQRGDLQSPTMSWTHSHAQWSQVFLSAGIDWCSCISAELCMDPCFSIRWVWG